jgi:hypothetical protein
MNTLSCGSFNNTTRKSDQLIVYVSILFYSVEHNYYTTEREALVMVFALHKFMDYILGNKLCISYRFSLLGKQTIGLRENN